MITSIENLEVMPLPATYKRKHKGKSNEKLIVLVFFFR